MINLDYYGKEPKGATTFLEFGSIDLNHAKKEVYDLKKDQQAYDWFMLGRYTNDIVIYDNLIQQFNNNSLTCYQLLQAYFQQIHHKHDFRFNIYKLLGLQTAIDVLAKGSDHLSFYELGQTLFGCIEGMHFAQAMIKSQIELQKINWYGVDISLFFNQLAKKFHPDYKLEIGENFTHLPEALDTFFAKGVTMLYAVNSAQSIVDLIHRCKNGFFDYSFCLNGNQVCYIPTGKQVTYVDYTEFKELISSQSIKVVINQSTAQYNVQTHRVYVECFFGSAAMCEHFIQLINNVEEGLIAELANDNELVRGLLGTTQLSNWVDIEEYMNYTAKARAPEISFATSL